MDFVKIETKQCPVCRKRRNITQFDGKNTCKTCRGVHLKSPIQLAKIALLDKRL